MKILRSKAVWTALAGVITAIGLLFGSIEDAKANSSIQLGFDNDSLKLSRVINGSSTAVFGPGKYCSGNAWYFGGYNSNNYSNVEIWITGDEMGSQYPVVPGFNSPSLLRTGSYKAYHVEGSIVSFFNYMPQDSVAHKIIWDTNINGQLDWVGMQGCTWTGALASAYDFVADYESYSSSKFNRKDATYDFFGVVTKNQVGGKYQIGVGCDRDTNELEFYVFYQYWEGGVLKRKYLEQTTHNIYELTATSTPKVVMRSRLDSGKVALPGTIQKVSGRVYYIGVDSSLDGVHNAGLDVEIP